MTRDCGHSTGDDQRLRWPFTKRSACAKPAREDCAALERGTGKALQETTAERPAR
ncbi:unnamed protein product, partial [Staurois parvus]